MTDDPLPFDDPPSSDSPLDEGVPGDPEPDSSLSEPFRLAITDVFDLHSVPPKDIEAVVAEYLHECYRLGLTKIRIVHGKGIGVQRATVRVVLQRTKFVAWFGDAPMEAGGWGATVITLHKKPGL
jgi:dsDNA-specific endonuclease/ATPase MutS2